MVPSDPSIRLQGLRSVTPQGLRTACTEACSMAMVVLTRDAQIEAICRWSIPSVRFGAAKAWRFGTYAVEAIRLRHLTKWLLRHPIASWHGPKDHRPQSREIGETRR